MSNTKWHAGYFKDLTYTYGYFPFLNPAMMRMACLSSGVAPQLRERPIYLELGFGQGLSINMHAAATEAQFWGNDFNPAQTAQARALAAASGADLHVLDDSFEQLAARDDLPDFDIIALHGVWSWISEDNRQTIVEVLQRKLRPGGMVYLSYNCVPGWAPHVPTRELMMLYGEHIGGWAAAPRTAIANALKFSADIAKAGSAYFRDNPIAAHHLAQLMGKPEHYIAHEYLNADWHLTHFREVAKSLGTAQLGFIGSIRLLDKVDDLHLTSDGLKILAEIKDPLFRETIRDYLVNQEFRCDVFIKGPKYMTASEVSQAWHEQQFVLTSLRDVVPHKIAGAQGEITLPKDLYDPLLDALAADHYKPKRIADLVRHPKLAKVPIGEIVGALTILVGAGHLSPAQTPTTGAAEKCKKLNRHICERALQGSEIMHLASPVTGGGVVVPRNFQLCIAGYEQGMTAAQLARRVYDLLNESGGMVTQGERSITSKEEMLKVLTQAANDFLGRAIPLLSAQKVM